MLRKRLRSNLKLALIPHAKNDYRPHLIRRYGLIAVVFIVFGLQVGYNLAKTGNVLGNESSITITSLLEQTNQARLNTGESALKLKDSLNQAAYLKAQDMFADQYWAHDAPDGTQPWKWLNDVSYNYDQAGENLAKNFSTTEAVMAAWMASPEHKENILNSNYQDVGFAVVDGELEGKPTSLIVAFYGLSAEKSTTVSPVLFTSAVNKEGNSVIAQTKVAFETISPATILSLVIIALTVFVAALAHAYRHKLPKELATTWYRHHGIYKILGLVSFAVVLVLVYGGGQI